MVRMDFSDSDACERRFRRKPLCLCSAERLGAPQGLWSQPALDSASRPTRDFLLDNIYSSPRIYMHWDGKLFTMTKLARQQAILEIARQGPIDGQEELQHRLARRGLDVGQATLSRDLRELGLVKTVHGYTLPGNGHPLEAGLPPVERLVREFVQSIRPAQNLIVLKTVVGSAQPVAAALDAQAWPEVVGTIAGDDAILIVSPDKKGANRLAQRIREMLA